jgi:hypothetical protein
VLCRRNSCRRRGDITGRAIASKRVTTDQFEASSPPGAMQTPAAFLPGLTGLDDGAGLTEVLVLRASDHLGDK